MRVMPRRWIPRSPTSGDIRRSRLPRPEQLSPHDVPSRSKLPTAETIRTPRKEKVRHSDGTEARQGSERRKIIPTHHMLHGHVPTGDRHIPNKTNDTSDGQPCLVHGTNCRSARCLHAGHKHSNRKRKGPSEADVHTTDTNVLGQKIGFQLHKPRSRDGCSEMLRMGTMRHDARHAQRHTVPYTNVRCRRHGLLQTDQRGSAGLTYRIANIRHDRKHVHNVGS